MCLQRDIQKVDGKIIEAQEKIIYLNDYEIGDDEVSVPTNIKIENYNDKGDLIITNIYSISKDSIKSSNQANENFIIKLR